MVKVEELQELLNRSLQDVNTVDVCRVCNHVRMSYSHQLSGAESKLSLMQSKTDTINCLCEQVGLNDVNPLISLMELLLCVEAVDAGRLSKCTEILKRHQAKAERLSACVECTSPPRTPVCPYMCSRPTLFLCGSFGLKITPHHSPPSSPPDSPMASGGQSLTASQSLLPSGFVQFLSNDGPWNAVSPPPTDCSFFFFCDAGHIASYLWNPYLKIKILFWEKKLLPIPQWQIHFLIIPALFNPKRLVIR